MKRPVVVTGMASWISPRISPEKPALPPGSDPQLNHVSPRGQTLAQSQLTPRPATKSPDFPAGSDPQLNHVSPRGQTPEPGSTPKLNHVLPFDLTPAESAVQMAYSVIEDALKEAGNPEGDIACTFSASKPLFGSGGEEPTVPLRSVIPHGPWWGIYQQLDPKKDVQLLVSPPDVVLRSVIKRFGFRGESRNIVAACATGAYSIATAARWIEQGLCDIAVAGSVEPAPHPLYVAGFRKMGVISEESVMRPFDARRSGFVFGEGAAAIVLESEDHANRRGATPLARLSGWAMGSDSHGPVSFNSKGERIAGVIRQCLAKAGLHPKDVSHVNPHGTGTAINDSLETQAIHRAFGTQARDLAVSATKSRTGHLLGAAGSVEFVLTVKALQEQRVEPTLHWQERDPACDLDYVPEAGPRPWNIRHAVSLSFGFGGPIGVLAVTRV